MLYIIEIANMLFPNTGEHLKVSILWWAAYIVPPPPSLFRFSLFTTCIDNKH